MKTNNWIIIAVVVVVLVIGAWFFYRKGKKEAEGPQIKYPTGGNGIPPDWSPLPLVERLKDVMSGLFTFSGTKDEAWTQLRDLASDDMVVAVYNTFGQKYFGEGNGTLTQWITDEANYDYTSGVKESTLARLRNLKLA